MTAAHHPPRDSQRDGAALTQVFTFVFINAGRGPLARVAALWEAVRAAVGRAADVLLAVEVDEADDDHGNPANSDHGFLKRLFRGWRRPVWRYREVVLVRPGLNVPSRGTVAAGVGLDRWSPPRRVSWADVSVEARSGTTLITGPRVEAAVTHFAADQDNGRRPSWVVRFLGRSKRQTRRALARRARIAHRAGDHFVAGLDANELDLDPIHPDEVRLVDAHPDFLLAVPAPGWRVVDVEHHTVPNPLEKFHPIHVCTVTFQEIR